MLALTESTRDRVACRVMRVGGVGGEGTAAGALRVLLPGPEQMVSHVRLSATDSDRAQIVD